MKKNVLLSGFIASAMIIFSGCASKMQAPQNSGFFEDYKEFKSGSNLLSDADKLSQYKKVYIEDVTVISAISKEEQTDEQKKLYEEISTYATSSLKEALKFKSSDKKTKDSLVMKSALSASEVHFDDNNWNQLSPLALGITVVSLNAYIDESARLVGEYTLDVKSEVISKSLHILKDTKISLNDDFLTINDLKNSIDAWVNIVASEINKGIK